MKKPAYLNLLGFVAMITVNALANILPIAGRSTGAVSQFTQNLFVPAGFTFSIWGVIYLLIAFFVVISLVRSKDKLITQITSRIGYLFFLTCLLNAGWLFAWHYLQFGLSMVLMVGLLIALLAIYVRLENVGIKDFSLESWTMRLPFRVYVGWISVATIANMAALLTFYQFDGFGIDHQIWTNVMITIATFLGITMLFKNRDYGYPSVIIWALWGIYKKRLADLEIIDVLIERWAIVMIAIMLLFMVFHFIRKQFFNRSHPSSP